MYTKCTFDENYLKCYDVAKIQAETKAVFKIIQKAITLAGTHIPQFLATRHLQMTSLTKKQGKEVIKCRIQKP